MALDLKASLEACKIDYSIERITMFILNEKEDSSISKYIPFRLSVYMTFVSIALCIMLIIPFFGITVHASVSGDVIQVVSQTHAYTEPDVESEVILDLNVGDVVFVTGEDGDFYVIYYKGMTGYVPKYAIDGTQVPSSVAGVSINPDAASLASSYRLEMEENNKAVTQELQDQEEYNEALEEYIEQQKRKTRNKIIWIVVIVLLCSGMIAVGVISVIRGKSDDTVEDDSENDDDNGNG